eukprot:SAG31_NODE_2315_length_5951_cov_9.080472_3_plen_128_part_00
MPSEGPSGSSGGEFCDFQLFDIGQYIPAFQANGLHLTISVGWAPDDGTWNQRLNSCMDTSGTLQGAVQECIERTPECYSEDNINDMIDSLSTILPLFGNVVINFGITLPTNPASGIVKKIKKINVRT